MADEADDSAEEIEAKAHLIEAEKALIEARLGFWDRLIMRGVIPVALIVAGPATTYYFSQRADRGVEEVRRVADSVRQLDEVVEGAKKAAAQAEEARAQELLALRRIVSSLQWTIVVQQVREAVRTSGRQEIHSRIAMNADAKWTAIRSESERAIYDSLVDRIDADPTLLRDAIRGAVDEIAPEFERDLSARGEALPAIPNEPRYPTKGR